MKNHFRAMILAVATIFAVGFAIGAQAAEVTPEPVYTTWSDTSEYNVLQLMCRKLGRGVVAVGFGALELPIKVMEINFEHGSLPALTWGVFEGLGWFVAREVVGVVDILTFYMPLPGCTFNKNIEGWGYGPIMEPEWVITPETNAYGLFYSSNRTMDY